MLIIKDSRITHTIDRSTYPGGEVFLRFKLPIFEGRVEITAHLRSSYDVMELLMATDAIRRQNRDIPISLVCPYFPYARQDRVCNPGEALSVKVMADLINSQGYSSVEIWDPHSDVTPALINNVKVRNQWEFTKLIPDEFFKDTVIIAPDAGAFKKAFKTAQARKCPILTCEKVRDTRTGEIIETRIHDYKAAPGMNYLIVDDICDGGRTFIEIAKKLRFPYGISNNGPTVGFINNCKIYLYVTHGIFSKDRVSGADAGSSLRQAGINHIFSPNVWPDLTSPWVTHHMKDHFTFLKGTN